MRSRSSRGSTARGGSFRCRRGRGPSNRLAPLGIPLNQQGTSMRPAFAVSVLLVCLVPGRTFAQAYYTAEELRDLGRPTTPGRGGPGPRRHPGQRARRRHRRGVQSGRLVLGPRADTVLSIGGFRYGRDELQRTPGPPGLPRQPRHRSQPDTANRLGCRGVSLVAGRDRRQLRCGLTSRLRPRPGPRPLAEQPSAARRHAPVVAVGPP